MALTELQKLIMRRLSANRSESSYLAGGLILNIDWPRKSDDIDIFHDTDEEVSGAAEKDIADLRSEGFNVTVDVRTYGTFEATVSDGVSSTVIQWMSDSRIRFFPLVKDDQWGLRLHRCDLAVNKILAASSRKKARDFADVVSITANMCPLGPLIMAASGKPPNYSPQKIIDQIRWHAQAVSGPEYASVKGLPPDWTAEFIRAEVTRQTTLAESYIMSAPVEVVGVLSVDADGLPIEVTSATIRTAVLRKATEEPDVMPAPTEFGAVSWTP